MKLLLFLFIAYGVSNIIVFGSIFKGFRSFCERVSPKFLGMLFTCMICLPTWVGFLGSSLVWSPTLEYQVVTHDVSFFGLFNISKEFIATFLDGCLTSGAVWLIHSFQESMERHFNVEK